MHADTAGERLLTELDHARLTHLGGAQHLPALAEVLDSTDLVTSREVPPDVVTMYSQVVIEERPSGRRHKLTLCYPGDAEPSQGFISVLSPVGVGLLGLRVGARARWNTPGGDTGEADIVALLFQPEASGDYTL